MFTILKLGKGWMALSGLITGILVLTQVATEQSDALVMVQSFSLPKVAPRTRTSSTTKLRMFKDILFPTRDPPASQFSKIPFVIEQLGDRPKKGVGVTQQKQKSDATCGNLSTHFFHLALRSLTKYQTCA
jgi:hypothetical protein